MKTSRIRSLLAIGLALCLLLMTLPVMGLGVAAEDYVDVTLSVVSMADQSGSSRYLFKLDGLPDTTGLNDALHANNTVYIDGEAVANAHYATVNDSTTQVYFYIAYSTITAGATTSAEAGTHVLRLAAGSILANKYRLTNDLYFYLNKGSVSQLTPAVLAVESVHDQSGSKRYLNYVTLYGVDGNPCDSKAYSGFTSYLDGVATTAFRLDQRGEANDGGLYYICDYSGFGDYTSSASIGNHTIELRAGTVIGSCVLTNDTTFAIHNGTIGVVTSEVIGRPTSTNSYSTNAGHWRIAVNFDQVPAYGGYYYGLTVESTDITITDKVSAFYRNGQTFMLFCWGSGTEDPVDGATVTAKAGTAVSADCTSILHLPEDLTVKWHAATRQWYYVPNPEADTALELDPDSTSSAKGIYFLGDNAFETPAWGTHLYGFTPDSGVFLNGEKVTCAFQNQADGKYYLGDFASDLTVNAGDELTIKGYFHSTIYNVDAYFEELTLVWNGSAWGIPSEEDDTVHLSATGVHHSDTSQGQWRIYLNMTALPSVGAEYQGLTVETDGITITDTTNCFYKTGNYFMIVCYGSGTAAPADGSTITIRAGQATHKSDATQKITLDKDIVVQYIAGRNAWYLVGSTAEPLVTTKLTLDGEQTGKTGIYFKGDNVYETPAWGNHLSSADITGGVYLNGTFVSGALFQNHADGKYYLGSFGSPTQAGDTLRICGNFVNAGMGRVVCFEDVTFVWTGTRWSPIIDPDEADVELTLSPSNNSSTNGIYLDSVDGLPVSGWTENVLSAWEYGKDNGVLVNGVPTDVFLRKYANGHYYVCLADKHITIREGDTVTVQGDFTYGGYTVEFLPISLIWNGTDWRLLYEIAPLPSSASLDFNTTPTDPLAYNGDWSCNYYFIEGGVYLNGAFNGKSDSRLVKLGSARYYTAGLPTTVAGDIVTIDGRITDGTDIVQIARTNFLKGEDGTWSVISDETYDRLLTLTVTPELSTADGDLTLVLKPSVGLPGELESAEFSGLSVVVGSTVLNPTFVKNDRGMLAFTVAASDLPSGSTTVTVKRGLLRAADTAVTYYVNKDTVAYINDYGIGAEGTVTRTELSLTLQSSSDASLTYSGNVTALGELTAVGTDSGVFVDGIRVRATVTAADGTLTVALPRSLKAGETVLVSGVWQSGEQQLTFPSVAAAWNGSTATAVAGDLTLTVRMDITDSSYLLEGDVTVDGAASGVLYKAGTYRVVRSLADRTVTTDLTLYRMGDLNNDDRIDILDVVLQKRYEADSSVEIRSDALVGEVTLRKDILSTTKTDAALPTDMLGQTSVDTFITSVTDTNAGTTVIGMADSDNGYTPNAEAFNDFGLDYVIDLNVDRPIKILQLTDTQIIDAAQERTPDRLGASSDAAWATDQMDEVLFDCLRAAVAEAKPDFIIMTGDNVYGEFDDAGTSYQKLVEVMDSLQIPWAPVYGNHDNESAKGVTWQNALLADSPYCLFNPRHDIGGNGNYAIGVAKNGELQRVVYMMDTNYCGASTESADLVKKTPGFTDAQKDWILNLGLRVNTVAGKTVPSLVGYHVESKEVWLGAIAAGYEDGAEDLNSIQYELGVDTEALSGDSGFKRGRHAGHDEEGWLEILQTIGADGTFFGHQHVNSLSVMYGGVRWTYGLKTGAYDQSPAEQGGTLITLSDDGSTFELEHIIVTQ